jgi:tripartite-type tricarboxylate transporter receptor subunit TctC
MNALRRTCLVLALGLAAGASVAQDAWPSRPIRLVVGFPPGGGGDSVARLFADHMSRTLRQQVVVENRPGAGTTLAPAAVASAPPDGYTLLLAPDSAFGADKLMYAPNVRYDETSFTPISKWASTFFVMAANPQFGARNLADITARAKAGKDGLFVASTQGLYPSLILETFNRNGIKLTQVPYKGGAPATMAVVAGEVPLTFSVPSSIMPMVKDGKLNAVAITAARRSALTPDVPTLAELGLKSMDVSYWFGLAGPAGLPNDVVQKLFDASAAALADPAVLQRLQNLGYDPAPSRSAAEFRTQALQDGAALRKVVEQLGIKGN